MNIETSIDCLPPEIICEIMKNLNLDDLIQCKLVSKQWYSIVTESSKMVKLIVRDDEKIEKRNVHLKEYWINIINGLRWYYSNELVNEDLQYCEFNSFQVNLERKILSNLKYLRINEIPNFDFNQLNLLTELIHLEINCNLKANHLTLNLLELEVLKINLNSSCHLTIECPKLKILYYNGRKLDSNSKLIIKYPESIKYLESISFDGSESEQFKNLEYLIYNLDFNLINENTLSELKKLKAIYFNVPINKKLRLRNYLRTIHKLKRFDLKLYCLGLQITDHNIYQINFENLDTTHFYAVNYKYLQDSLPFIDYVDYTRLVDLINPIPTDYFKKFIAISTVSADGKLHQAHFLWFLKNLKSLKKLTLRSTSLHQSFYDELPKFCSLIKFELKETDKELDFNFLIQFNKLIELRLEQELSLKLVKSLIHTFERLNYLISLSFILKKRYFQILRCSDNCYNISDNFYNISDFGYKDVKSKINLKEVISYFERLEYF